MNHRISTGTKIPTINYGPHKKHINVGNRVIPNRDYALLRLRGTTFSVHFPQAICYYMVIESKFGARSQTREFVCMSIEVQHVQVLRQFSRPVHVNFEFALANQVF